jgi:hypothetical protein
MKPLLTLVSLIALAVGSAQARSIDLSLFKGKYNGTTTLNYGGNAYTGPASLAFKVKPSGKAGTLSVASSITAGGGIDTSNSFQFFASHAMNIAKIAPAIQNTPLSGTYTSTTRTINASAAYFTAGIIVTCKLKQSGHKATLTVVETINSGGSVLYQITYTGTRHVK